MACSPVTSIWKSAPVSGGGPSPSPSWEFPGADPATGLTSSVPRREASKALRPDPYAVSAKSSSGRTFRSASPSTSGTVTFGLMAAIGKIELDNFRERSTLGKRGTAKQGRVPTGGLPYGYRIGDDGRPEVVEEQAEVVRRIFHMYVHEGMGSPSIAVRLTDEGIPTQTGKLLWRQSYIHYVLANATYTGAWVYGKERHISTEDGTKSYDQPRETWIEVPVRSRRWWTRRPGNGRRS